MTHERECNDLQKEVEDLEAKIEYTKKSENEKLERENNSHRDEVEKIKTYNSNLKEELQNLLEGKK